MKIESTVGSVLSPARLAATDHSGWRDRLLRPAHQHHTSSPRHISSCPGQPGLNFVTPLITQDGLLPTQRIALSLSPQYVSLAASRVALGGPLGVIKLLFAAVSDSWTGSAALAAVCSEICRHTATCCCLHNWTSLRCQTSDVWTNGRYLISMNSIGKTYNSPVHANRSPQTAPAASSWPPHSDGSAWLCCGGGHTPAGTLLQSQQRRILVSGSEPLHPEDRNSWSRRGAPLHDRDLQRVVTILW